jgi:hypothetical protein
LLLLLLCLLLPLVLLLVLLTLLPAPCDEAGSSIAGHNQLLSLLLAVLLGGNCGRRLCFGVGFVLRWEGLSCMHIRVGGAC